MVIPDHNTMSMHTVYTNLVQFSTFRALYKRQHTQRTLYQNAQFQQVPSKF